RVGRISATFGEVRHRAEVVVFWLCDPLSTHPRLWERVIEPAGRFIPLGRAGRTVLVAQDSSVTTRCTTASAADETLRLDRNREIETLWCLRALIAGQELADDAIARSTGVNPSALRSLAERLRSARYGALFFAPPHDDRPT